MLSRQKEKVSSTHDLMRDHRDLRGQADFLRTFLLSRGFARDLGTKNSRI